MSTGAQAGAKTSPPPSLDDFRSYVRSLLAASLRDADNAVDEVTRKAGVAGVAGSTMATRAVIEKVRAEVIKGVDATLAAIERTARRSVLDRSALRHVGQEELELFVRLAKNAARLHSPRDTTLNRAITAQIAERLAEFDAIAVEKLRHFDGGFLDFGDPELPGQMVHNSVSIGTAIASPIQQGNVASSQTVTASATLNVEAALSAIDELEAALAATSIAAPTKADIEADIATLRAQLRKSNRSPAIVRQVFQSVRSVVEGVGAGLATPAVAAAIAALASALGAG